MHKNNITAFDYILMLFKRARPFELVHDLLTMRKIVKNLHDIIFFWLGIKQSFTIIFRTGKQIRIDKPSDFFNFWHYEEMQMALLNARKLGAILKIDKDSKLIKLELKNKVVKFNYDSLRQIANTLYLITEQFIGEQYRWLNAKDKMVIDLGANIGDSAIYFALMGAKQVYAFEPYPYSYFLASKNIADNKLENKILLLNEGVGKKSSKIKIDAGYKSYGGTDLKRFGKGKDVRITTLEEIVNRFDIKDAVLKIDCEGCEYGIILNTKGKILRKFGRIIIEYHYGYINLKRKLEKAGFKVRRTYPTYVFDPEASNHNMLNGLIYAKRL